MAMKTGIVSFSYTVYLNQSRGATIWRGFTAGDVLSHAYDGTVHLLGTELKYLKSAALAQFVAFEKVYQLHSSGAGLSRALCVGDVVVIGEVAASCEPVGWAVVATSELQSAISQSR